MSGIIGIYRQNGRLETDELSSMLDTIAHRGSDGANIWHQDNVGFGHRMLWTTPESLLEKLPWCDSTYDTAITADARIDNRDELISLLDLKHLPAEKITDSSLILRAYHKWGVDCLEKLLGDFAFAIWDGKKQQLFCGRDHFGVKPFYYYGSDSLFTFASEIKALFSLPEVPRQLDETKIASYLIGDFDDLALTFYQQVLRLPPAHYLVISSEGISSSSYWSLDINSQIGLQSDEAYATEFNRLFTEAVRCRLRSAFAVGSELSGGLDSSAVACIARNLLREADEPALLQTFSAVFDNISECDERPFIDEVLKQGGFQPHYMLGDSRTPLTDVEDIFHYGDEAFFAPGFAAMNWGLCKLASDRGVRILLNGHDGDSTVSHGFGYLHDLAKAGRWLRLHREMRGVAKIYGESVWHGFWNYFSAYTVQNAIRYKPVKLLYKANAKLLRISKLKRASSTSNNPCAGFNPDFVARTELERRYRNWYKNERSSRTSSQRHHYRLLTQGLHSLALEIDDKAASAFGLEIRYPFWDKRLVEFCFALPAEQKLAQGWSRVVMRRAMAGILPAKVQWRTSKMDFTPNFKHGLLVREKQCLEQLIFQDETLGEYVDLTILRQKYREGEDVQFIWRAVSLGLWLRYISTDQPAQTLKQSEYHPMA